MIKVITYDAPHRKTQDLLIRLKLKGYNNIHVVATPWKNRKNFTPLIPHRNFIPLELNPSKICETLGFSFERCSSILETIKSDEDLYLIAGAGIIEKKILDKCKIINSHPAYLPYVRGLDSYKWAIYYGKPIGVTSHIISEEADSGYLIKKALVPIYNWDTFHSLALRQYELEIDLLVDSIEDIKTAPLDYLSTHESEVMRRMPHSKEKKLLDKFENLKMQIAK